jgi:hypothetical protein
LYQKLERSGNVPSPIGALTFAKSLRLFLKYFSILLSFFMVPGSVQIMSSVNIIFSARIRLNTKLIKFGVLSCKLFLITNTSIIFIINRIGNVPLTTKNSDLGKCSFSRPLSVSIMNIFRYCIVRVFIYIFN